jgi:predicted nuclease of predicted toxin-antitoxin system
MRFFLDHNVPIGVADCFKAAGHEVLIQKDIIAPDAADPVVAIASAAADAVLVSFDKDHNAIAHRHGISNRKLKKLSRIHLRCEPVKTAERIKAAMSFIEFEWREAMILDDQRMFIEILGKGLKTHR